MAEYKTLALAEQRAEELRSLYPEMWIERWLDFPDGKGKARPYDLAAQMEVVVREYNEADRQRTAGQSALDRHAG